MPNVRDILRRFRPAAAPGPAATGGVPADRVAEREAELAPVLALLEDVERECAQLLEAARAAATERRAQGDGQVEAVLAAGRRRADEERAAAAAARRGLADEEAQRVVRDSQDEASTWGGSDSPGSCPPRRSRCGSCSPRPMTIAVRPDPA